MDPSPSRRANWPPRTSGEGAHGQGPSVLEDGEIGEREVVHEPAPGRDVDAELPGGRGRSRRFLGGGIQDAAPRIDAIDKIRTILRVFIPFSSAAKLTVFYHDKTCKKYATARQRDLPGPP